MSDSISVLLHAAARGARLQQYYGEWNNAYFCPTLKESKHQWRIHPEDAHLRYGPISSVLLEKAKDEKTKVSGIVSGAWRDNLCCGELFEYFEASELTRSLFLLFVAESLVEEGL